MNKLKKLSETRAKLIKEMERATEQRDFKAFDKLAAEIDNVDVAIDREKNKINSDIQRATSEDFINAEDLNSKEFIREFAAGETNDVDFSEFTRSVLFNEGEYRAKTNVDASVIMPKGIAAEVIYKALNQSVLLRNTQILPMDNGTVTIGRINENVQVDFKERGALGLQTGLGLEPVTLEAKTLYAWVSLAEEDIQDIVNLENVLRNALSGAIAETLDKNFLYTNAAASGKQGIYPTGLLDSTTICKIEVDKFDYDAVLKGCLEISKNNGEATNVGLNPITEFEITSTKDSLGQYIKPPVTLGTAFNTANYTVSNGLKESDMLIFDRNAVVIGLRRNMDLKIVPDVKTGSMLMRVMFRADVATIQDKHVCKVSKKATK